MLASIKCLVSKHRSPDPYQRARNGVLTFGDCAHCGATLVRFRGRWTRVPDQYRVVWNVRSRASGTARDIADGRVTI